MEEQIPFQLETLPDLLKSQSLKIVSAFLVLIIGWLVALIISGLARKAIRRTGLEEAMQKSGNSPQKFELDKWAARGVFYSLMLLVFIGFFELLGLSVVSEPLNQFLMSLIEYAPRLVGPVILIFVAWIVATCLKFIIVRLMGSERLHRFFETNLGLEGSFQRSVAVGLGNTVYWVIFLLFSIAVLEALELHGLLEPLQEMLNQILSFLPNVVAAALILGFGWFLARIVQRIATNILTTIGTDRLSDKVGLRRALGSQSLSGLVALIAYVTVLIPVLIASLNALKLESITEPASEMLSKFLVTLPSLFAAGLVLFVAYLVGRVLSNLVTNILTTAGFDRVLAKLGIGQDPKDYATMLAKLGIGDKPVEGKRTPSEIVGTILLFVVVLFAAIEALDLIGFEAMAGLLTKLVEFGGRVVVGLFIFAIGLMLSNLAAKTILTNSASQTVLALVTRIAILVLSGAMALQQMGLAEQIINLAFGILLGSVALSVAIAFGIGGRDVAAGILKDIVSQLKRSRNHEGPPQV